MSGEDMNSTSTARERILKAAFELISSKGYLGASTREIAQQAQVAEVTLFRQFASKESLFAEVLRSFSVIPVLCELMPHLKLLPYKEALETLILRFLEQIEANRDWIRVLSCEISHAPVEMKNIYGDFLKQLFSVLTDFFVNARDRGFIRPDLDPEHTARAFHSMIFGFFHFEGLRGIDVGHVTEYAEMVDVFVDIFCRGTKTPD
jgi:AcrR family transcriptional regulator